MARKWTDAEIEQQARTIVERPYQKVLQRDPEAGYLATVPDFDGCMTDGATEAEALRNLEEAMMVWVEAALAAGRPIPEPASSTPSTRSVSGKLLLRMPKSLHAHLLDRAAREGVSANQLAVAAIARQIG